MLAMQYRFVLPADYDMNIIRRRIESKGALMDGFPGLAFKSFLYAERGETGELENSYAPFYLWNDERGMRRFLAGQGFEALRNSFGWPTIRTWVPVAQAGDPHDRSAVWATCERVTIPPHTALNLMEAQEADRARDSVASDGACYALAGYEPTTWTLVRFRHWRSLDKPAQAGNIQRYKIGHLAISEKPEPEQGLAV